MWRLDVLTDKDLRSYLADRDVQEIWVIEVSSF
jgi:hypothetical protein